MDSALNTLYVVLF